VDAHLVAVPGLGTFTTGAVMSVLLFQLFQLCDECPGSNIGLRQKLPPFPAWPSGWGQTLLPWYALERRCRLTSYGWCASSAWWGDGRGP
jgi:hypothetical protein